MASFERNVNGAKKQINDNGQDVHNDSLSKEDLCDLPLDEETEKRILRSRIEEQSFLICSLKVRADEVLLRCQCLEKINTDLDKMKDDMERDLKSEKKKSSQLEDRFLSLATNHQEIIKYKDEYKRQNADLKKENERLKSENMSLFSSKLEEQKHMAAQLTEELKKCKEQFTKLDNEYRKKSSDFEIVNKQYLSESDSLKKELKESKERCRKLDATLKQNAEKSAQKEAELQHKLQVAVKEKEELLELSMQRGKLIEEKQSEIDQLENDIDEIDDARKKAEKRFEKEASIVNADLRVQELQSQLEESQVNYSELSKEYEAYKKHSSDLLMKEKELNAKLRHMIK
ncbi:coiled-coil domain-containing protein 89 isoform X1 [Polypterus senegalus]|uniref:coiled-coil domain-containing protein 89 isoform X1 n=1 Tax=Polypterus senegalus TaxID=55291 RepID=UPI0019638DF3|nr:coiled-coil domain-containing protein 89 isoform X1 [Polypterus senegalus]